MALAAWSAPLMARGPQGDAFRPHWLVVPLEGYLAGRRVAEPTRVGLHVEGVTLGLCADTDKVTVEVEAAGPFDVELTAAAPHVLALVTGARCLDQVLDGSAVLTGDRSRLEALLAARANPTEVTS